MYTTGNLITFSHRKDLQKLTVRLLPQGKRLLREEGFSQDGGNDSILFDLLYSQFEPMCNGWHTVEPISIGALTSDPYLFSDNLDIELTETEYGTVPVAQDPDQDGKPLRVYQWELSYQTHDLTCELMKGPQVFNLVKSNE